MSSFLCCIMSVKLFVVLPSLFKGYKIYGDTPYLIANIGELCSSHFILVSFARGL